MTAETIARTAKPATGDPIRILVIEDTEEDCELLELALRRGGFGAICKRVDNAAAMRMALRDEKFDLVLCDFVLPGFSVEAAQKLLEEFDRDYPLIVVSGVVGTADVVKVLRSGADDFIEKEDLARLVPAVERALKNDEERRARRQAEEQLRQAQKMEAVGQLTGGIAHDFNNLLSAIWGNVELVREGVKDDSEAAVYLDLVTRAIQRGADLTHRLLSFTREQPLSPEITDVNRLVFGMVELLHRTIGAQVDIKSIESLGMWTATVDPAQLENALLNLILNARDAMPDGGTLTIETGNKELDADYARRNPAVVPGPYVMIAVSDTGHGVSRDVIDSIFEPFVTTKEAGKGTGLGLSMVFGFVKQSGGHISVHSEPGQGATFRLYLPKADQTASEEKTSSAQPHETIGGAESILLVEDDDDVRYFVGTALERLGYEVREAKDGTAALSLLDDGLEPDLLFTDLLLPKGMDGIAVVKEVVNRCPGIGTLLTSGYVDNALLQRNPAGLNMQFLAKPYSISDLAKHVRSALDGN